MLAAANAPPKRKRRFLRPKQLAYLVIVLLAVATVIALIVLKHQINERDYQLSVATKQLVGPPVASLDKQLKYDKKTGQFRYNPRAVNGVASLMDNKGDKGLTIGGSKYYGVSLAKEAKKGQTYTDASTKLSFSLIPEFSQADGRHVDGHLVYPFNLGQVVYTLKDNGLKEDIVVEKPTDQVSLHYKLRLPDTLRAKLLSDGSIGIYSADPALYGSISFGDSKSESAVQKARINGEKKYLVFGLPAPVVKTAHGPAERASAKFVLRGSTLEVRVWNLGSVTAPFTIDPSVVVTSAESFGTGNSKGMISFSAGGGVERSGITGANINSWSTSTLPSARYGLCAAATSGYLYAIGGKDGSNTLIPSVSYAAINSDGSLGSWQSGSNLIAPRSGGGCAAYNNHIYIVAGDTGGGANVDETEYASIDPTTGQIGAWQTTSSLPYSPGVGSVQVVAYNGYIYDFGGSVWGGSSYTNNVAYAPIHADGTLGTWQTSNKFTTGRDSFGAAVYNGYVYVMGGNETGYIGTDVQYARIQPDGSVGTWRATTSLIENGVYMNGAVASNGYLYAIGGWSGDAGTYVAKVIYAPIYADGSIGSWSMNPVDLPSATGSLGAAAYNGFIYTVGGQNSGGAIGSAYYGKAGPPGASGSFQATTAFTTPRYGLNSVAYNGYLYMVAGGYVPGTGKPVLTPVNDVQYAQIKPDGTVGTWSTTSSLLTARDYFGIAVYNGYMYVVGGQGKSANLSSAEYAQINSNGTLSAWQTTTSLPQIEYAVGMTQYNGYLYVAGGYNAGYSNAVFYAPINTNGTIGSWSNAPNMITAKAGVAMTSYNGYVYLLGGHDATTDYNTVYYALICTSANSGQGGCTGTPGTFGTLNPTASFTTGRDEFFASAYMGYMYLMGGQNNGTYYSDTQYAKINSDGTLNAWSSGGKMVHTLHAFGGVINDGYIYVLGGTNGTYYSEVDYAPINNGGSGTVGTWSSLNTFANAREYPGSVAYDGYLYVIGGYNSAGGNYWNDVQYAKINNDGTVGTWASTTSLPVGLSGISAVAYDGYLYVLGGKDSSGTKHNDVQYALICTSSNSGQGGCSGMPGTVGTWNTTTSFSTPRYKQSAVVYKGYMYLIGGYDDTNYYNDVQYALICTSSNSGQGGCSGTPGTVGIWGLNTTNFSTSRYSESAFAYNGYMYVMGGYSGQENNDVQVAPINSDGSIGSWIYTTSFDFPRHAASVIAYGGYVYVMGGSTGASATTNVEYAPIYSDGTIGLWNVTTALSQATAGAASAVSGGYVFLLGGSNLASDYATTYGARLNIISRAGHYSKVIDLASTINGDNGQDPQITGYSLTAGGDGEVDVCMRGADTTSATFGSAGCGNDIQSSESNYWSNVGRYVLISVDFEDNFSTVFSDSASIKTSVSEIDLYFRAAPNRRMRGGKTFTNINIGQSKDSIPLQQQLDTNGKI